MNKRSKYAQVVLDFLLCGAECKASGAEYLKAKTIAMISHDRILDGGRLVDGQRPVRYSR